MEIGLLIVHVLVGATMAAHGAQKLFGWFGGHGIAGTAGFLESLGLRPGKPMAIAAGTAELVGGALFAVGLVTPVAALLIASTLLVAAFTNLRKGFWIYNGGFEYELVLATVAIGLAFAGAGAWSLDAAIGWGVAGLWWGIGAGVLAALGAAGAVAAGRSGLGEPAPSAA
jgi:putative oxidoreductase